MNETALRLLNPDEKQINPENYIVIQGWMVSELKLSGASLLIYAIIYGFSQDKNCSFHGTGKYLSAWCQISTNRVYEILKDLTMKNLIIKEEEDINGVKICHYRTNKVGYRPTKLGTPPNKVGYPPPNKVGIDNIYIDKLNNNINKKTIQKNSPKETEDEIFNRFWELYPRQRRGSKEEAFKAWNKALKREDITPEQILAVVEIYANSDEVKRGYAKGCAAWLNGSCFLNEYQGIKATSDMNPVLEYFIKTYEPEEMLTNSVLRERYIRKHSSSADELLNACEGNVERAKEMINYYVSYIREKGKEFFLWDILNNFCRIHDALKYRKGGRTWEMK